MNRAYYHAPVAEFLQTSASTIIGELTRNFPHDLLGTQTRAWEVEIAHLSTALASCPDGHVFFEFQIPRIGKRADVVLLLRGIIFVIEYKIGADKYDLAAIAQTTDYALDLKNFHGGSHSAPIVPILVATGSATADVQLVSDSDSVFYTSCINPATFTNVIERALAEIEAEPIDADLWIQAAYRPTPTIVEAAQALFSEHSVDEISRSDAAENLTVTTAQVANIIEWSERECRKSVCFITGVPGAGKTLAGLKIATERQRAEETSRAVFLSGNDPLVRVLREALARNSVSTAQVGSPLTISEARRKTEAFIQNIRHFRDDTHKDHRAPQEHVVVFDEAQRAWRKEQLSSFMTRKRNDPNFNQSEPEFLLSVMDRHDWCCVVCLVGGGQEINTGEAGIGEWLKAIQAKFSHWSVYYPDQITGPEYDWDGDLEQTLELIHAQKKAGLHLSVALRSFRAEELSHFMSAVIAGDQHGALELAHKIPNYPLCVTRDLKTAQAWVKQHARGTERYGMLASSGASRLRPEGVVVKIKAEPEQWFLNGPEDVRSSFYLEDVATEFDVQGLELDWTVVCWDANFRRHNGKWMAMDFKGTKWQTVKDPDRQRYIGNSYRVLLTRARGKVRSSTCLVVSPPMPHVTQLGTTQFTTI